MSEVELNHYPRFARHLPTATANDRVNEIFRESIREAIDEERGNDFVNQGEYGAAVARNFYGILGSGAIIATVQELIESLPDRYVAHTPVYDTALREVDRVDYQSYAHPAVVSPLIALLGPDGGPYYLGTDKIAHFIQQGYDYFFIYKTVEEYAPGLGELHALSWGLWSEGVEITGEYVRNYLEAHGLPADEITVEETRDDIIAFMEDSDAVLYLSPTPEFLRGSYFLCWLADLAGTHKFGVLGDALTGIISYSDLAVNEAGLRFYFDLVDDPEGMAQNFDIADYVTPEWDEENLASDFSPVIQERIEEAEGNDIKWPFVYGYDIGFAGPPWMFSASMPVLYHMWRDLELRLRLGVSLPFSIDEYILTHETQGFASLDMAMRISGLHFAYMTATTGFSEALASDEPINGFHPSIEAGWEIMFWGWTSIRTGFKFDITDYTASWVVGLMTIWR